MVYLYAGLGVAMLTGIMAVFEMGLALTGQSLIPSTIDVYFGDPVVKAMDQNMLRLLKDPDQVKPGLEGSTLCNRVIDEYQSTFSGGSSLVVDTTSPLNANWLGACVMSNKEHRILIVPGVSSASIPYSFYSCILVNSEDQCSFERGS